MRLSARVDYALRAVWSWRLPTPRAPWSSCRRHRTSPTSISRASSVSSAVADCCGASAGPTAATGWAAGRRDQHRGRDQGAGWRAGQRSGSRPEHLEYVGAASALQEVWIALRASERAILESVTLAHVAAGELPPSISALVANPSAWS